MLDIDETSLTRVFDRLQDMYGPLHWWPGETPFEIMVGAVLTQNTAWSNVERAIARLKAADALSAETILGLPEGEVAELIRPAGYFNVKARRLRNFCAVYRDNGGEQGLAALETHELRALLLSANGVGPETADDILLYAFHRPVFVIDAYTRRIGARLGWYAGDEGYETLRQAFEAAIGPDVPAFNQYHALLVNHGKGVCRKRPRCGQCCLAGLCPVGTAS